MECRVTLSRVKTSRAGRRDNEKENERWREQRIASALMTESHVQWCALLKDARVVFARYQGKRRPRVYEATAPHRFLVNEMRGVAFERGINSQHRATSEFIVCRFNSIRGEPGTARYAVIRFNTICRVAAAARAIHRRMRQGMQPWLISGRVSSVIF